MRKLTVIIGTLAALLLATFTATAAHAERANASWGSIEGGQQPGTNNHYSGGNEDLSSSSGCTTVQTKINGAYTSDGISGSGKTACFGEGEELWYATAAVYSQATAIRLIDTSHAPLYLCTNQTQCQSYRALIRVG